MNMELYINPLFNNLLLILTMTTGMWITSLILKDASIMDIFWGIGFVIVAWFSLFLSGDISSTNSNKIITTILVSIWGIRLSIHIFIRNKGKGEDYRYIKMRKKHGPAFWIISLFQVFLLQGVLMFVITITVQFINASPMQLCIEPFTIAGTFIWIIGFFFESAGDFQLKNFLNNPANKGKVMNRGLWRYTRHPNYFGEAVMWWGIFIITLSINRGWITIISPVCITFLLLRVSGVTMLEKDLVKTNPEYSEYIKKTNSFLPWFPQK